MQTPGSPPNRATALTAAWMACLVAGATSLHAQGPGKVVPLWCEYAEGNDASAPPFQHDKGRFQQLWLGSHIAPNIGVINEIQYRRDTRETSPLNGFSQTATVTLGYCALEPETMSLTFAVNRTGQQTTVFTGTISYPNQPPASPVGPWNIKIPLPAPFFYTPAQGNLLLDYTVPGVATGQFNYPLDAHRTSVNGTASPYGTTGTFAGGDVVRLQANGVLSPGASMQLLANGLLQPYPAAIFFGTSSLWWARTGLLLPIDLTAFGAPTNSLYTGFDALVPMTIKTAGAQFEAELDTIIPNVRRLGHKTLYAQALFVDPPSNPLGIVFSNATAIGIGNGRTVSQILSTKDSSSPTGTTVFGSGDLGGPVVRFAGTFN